jgi:hypothetical protein
MIVDFAGMKRSGVLEGGEFLDEPSLSGTSAAAGDNFFPRGFGPAAARRLGLLQPEKVYQPLFLKCKPDKPMPGSTRSGGRSGRRFVAQASM